MWCEVRIAQKISSLLVVTSLVSIGYPALADPISQDSNEMSQVTNVNELRDVAPTDWAYEALRSLVERYGCIVGYPDRTFRGNKPLSRWEFAAGLNACLNTLERLIQEGNVSKEDIDKLRRLTQEFQAELAALGAKIDNLEGRVSFLENHQFSTTTKLNGEVIFSAAAASTSNNQAVFQNRIRLVFDTSFTGDDVLHTRLAAGNFVNFNSSANLEGFQQGVFSPQNTLAAAVGGTGNNSVQLDWLAYQKPIKLGENTRLDTYVAAVAGNWNDYVPTLSPYFQDGDGGNGSISSFAQQNPIYRIGGGSGAGLSLELGFLDSVIGPTALTVGYLAGPNPNTPTLGTGLTNGSYAVLGQITTNIGNFVNIGFTYVNAYQDQGVPIFNTGNAGASAAVLGSELANGLVTSATGDTIFDSRKVTNSYGVEVAFNLSKGVSLSAFGTYTSVNFVGDPNAGTGFRGTGEIWTYGGGIAFTDLFKEGSILGFFGGVQPYFGNVSTAAVGSLPQYNTLSPIHVEVFYKYPVSENISITPGVIWLDNPTQTANKQSQVIGVLRGTFRF